ncbi:hypothetical protein D3C87_2004610 [compost metagenome]
MVEGAHRVAQLQGLVIDPQQAVAQLHYRNVEGGADSSQFVAALHRYLQAQIAVTQRFGQ